MKNVSYVHAISVVGPGLPDWKTTKAILQSHQPYVPADIIQYQPALLPPNERRRASASVRIAFRIAEELTSTSTDTAKAQGEYASVFCSSDGDLAIAHRICLALAQPNIHVSPTDFHNSVHNAAAGYWSIAAAARGPSTAISAFDGSFAVGLLEAHAMVQVERLPTMLVTYDIPAPPPLHANRPVSLTLGVGLLLSHQATGAIAALHVTRSVLPPSRCTQPALEAIRTGNPSGAALPLLSKLCGNPTSSSTVVLPVDSAASIAVDVHLTPPSQ